MIDLPLILYVPGLLPKPEPRAHREALFRCLVAGLRRHNQDIALDIAANPHCFDVVSWTYDFYLTHRDISIDSAAIDAVIAQERATENDITEATAWKRRFARWLFTIADIMPFLIPHIADERLELHLRDLLRYQHNDNDIAEHTRQMLKMPLRAAAEAQRPVLLIGHSMGSVIAWDSLWQMSREDGDDVAIDLLLTMGSPLGQRFVQRRLLGYGEADGQDCPQGIRRWVNLAAIGDLTAVDQQLADDFGPVVECGLVESLEDRQLFNWFRLDGVLNVHAEYGYFTNHITAEVVSDWWQSVRTPRC